MSSKLILLRHGQSEWNKRNLFTGWVDIPLSQEGIQEAFEAGKHIAHLPVDMIYVSSLSRAQMTATIAMSVHRSGKVPVFLHGDKAQQRERIYDEETQASTIPVMIAWQLNERMYGELQGLNKQQTREKFGDAQVQIWRRSFDVAPPGGESLADTAARTIPYFESNILPHLKEGKNILIVAHGNSLRSIVMSLDGLSREEVVKLELATGEPLIYVYDKGKIRRG